MEESQYYEYYEHVFIISMICLIFMILFIIMHIYQFFRFRIPLEIAIHSLGYHVVSIVQLFGMCYTSYITRIPQLIEQCSTLLRLNLILWALAHFFLNSFLAHKASLLYRDTGFDSRHRRCKMVLFFIQYYNFVQFILEVFAVMTSVTSHILPTSGCSAKFNNFYKITFAMFLLVFIISSLLFLWPLLQLLDSRRSHCKKMSNRIRNVVYRNCVAATLIFLIILITSLLQVIPGVLKDGLGSIVMVISNSLSAFCIVFIMFNIKSKKRGKVMEDPNARNKIKIRNNSKSKKTSEALNRIIPADKSFSTQDYSFRDSKNCRLVSVSWTPSYHNTIVVDDRQKK